MFSLRKIHAYTAVKVSLDQACSHPRSQALLGESCMINWELDDSLGANDSLN